LAFYLFTFLDIQIPSSEHRRHFTDSGVHLQVRDKLIEGTTDTVSASDNMIILRQGLEARTKFILENPRTQQKVQVNVVRPAQLNPEGSLIPVTVPLHRGFSFGQEAMATVFDCLPSDSFQKRRWSPGSESFT